MAHFENSQFLLARSQNLHHGARLLRSGVHFLVHFCRNGLEERRILGHYVKYHIYLLLRHPLPLEHRFEKKSPIMR